MKLIMDSGNIYELNIITDSSTFVKHQYEPYPEADFRCIKESDGLYRYEAVRIHGRYYAFKLLNPI